MNKTNKIILLIILVVIVGGIIAGLKYADYLNTPLYGEKFASAEEAVRAYSDAELKKSDIDLDFCPPYELKFSFDYDNNTIAFLSYYTKHPSYGGTNAEYSYIVIVLEHNSDGTLNFTDSFAEFIPKSFESVGTDYYYYTKIKTNYGVKTICFLYQDRYSTYSIYFDGVKTEKIPVEIDGKSYYICYAVSDATDNTSGKISERHSVERKTGI